MCLVSLKLNYACDPDLKMFRLEGQTWFSFDCMSVTINTHQEDG